MATYQFDTVQGTTIAFDPSNDTLDFATGSAAQLRFAASGSDLVVYMGEQWVTLANNTYAGLGSFDLTFADGSLFLAGTGASESLTGGAGADFLDGRAGADTMIGSVGDDTYVVESGGDSVVEAASEGFDTVRTVVSHTLGANIEAMWIRGAGAVNGYGNSLNNTFYSGDGNNQMHGGAGNDTVSYAYAVSGVDVWLAAAGAQATGGSGNDTLVSIENLAGSAYADLLRGNSFANRLSGSAGNDTLNGGLAVDTLIGGTGDDTYIIDTAGDVLQEDAGSGVDTVVSNLTGFALGANFENLRLASSGSSNGYGNGLDNIFYAGDGNNSVNGGTGNDTLSYEFSSGNVIFDMNNAAQVRGSSGYDQIANIDNITGSAFGDSLIGNNFANRLDGGGGNDTLQGAFSDTLIGGLGDDRYVISPGAVIVEQAGAGTDQVWVTFNYTLGANIEEARILNNVTGVTLNGNSLDNVLYGSAGNGQAFNGGSGNDTVSYFYFDNPSNSAGVTVDLGAGTTQFPGSSNTTRTHTLTSIENAIGSTESDMLIGNAGDNRLEGGTDTDTLDGGAGGVDTLVGGINSDTYRVRDEVDVIVEESGELAGTADTVVTYLAGIYTLQTNLENVTIGATNDGAGATGNAADNFFYDGVGSNVIDGAGGRDTLSFGLSTIGVTVSLALGSATHTDGKVDTYVNFENLFGSSYNDTLAGDGANNIMDGGSGNDAISGGNGDDLLYGQRGADTLTGGIGYDRMQGGRESDVFRFTTANESFATPDLIFDFGVDVDMIDVSAIDADVVTTGDQAFTFIDNAAFSGTDATGQLRYENGILQGSTDADADAEFVVLLNGAPYVGESYFIL